MDASSVSRSMNTAGAHPRTARNRNLPWSSITDAASCAPVHTGLRDGHAPSPATHAAAATAAATLRVGAPFQRRTEVVDRLFEAGVAAVRQRRHQQRFGRPRDSLAIL